MTTKTCIKCGATKDIEEFLLHYNNQRGKHYRRGDCRDCRNAARAANTAAKARAAQLKRDKYQADPEYRARLLSHQHKSRMGISTEDKMAMLAEQGGGCAACGTTEPSGHGWATDHDHACCPGQKSCGECIRGILCQGCNLALGHTGDSIERLRALIAYLSLAGLTAGGNANLQSNVSRMQPAAG